MRCLAGFLLAWLLVPGPAVAQAVLVQAENRDQVLDCRGGEARVEGNRNRLVLRGACRAVRVFGESNRVTAEVASGAQIEVQGQHNRITYALPGGGEPPYVSVAGLDDTVLPGALPPAAVASAPPARPREEARPTPAPLPRPAAPAPPLRAASTPVTATPGLASGPAPGPAIAPAAVPAGPLVLRGDDQERADDCAGRDAVIEGHRSNYVLRGACRSLSVRGDLIVVQAEVAPHARIVVDGNGTAVHWLLAGRGALPSVAIRGDTSRAVRTSRLVP